MTLAPWNASWTAENIYEVRPCRWAGGKLALWSPHKPNEGKPMFAKPHMVRQRRSIAEYRCTVCGEKTVAGQRWHFGLGHAIEGYEFVTTEAPVHRQCADLALKICPHLRALNAKPLRWFAPTAVLSAIIGGPTTENDFGIDLKGRAIVGHLKFAFRINPCGWGDL